MSDRGVRVSRPTRPVPAGSAEEAPRGGCPRVSTLSGVAAGPSGKPGVVGTVLQWKLPGRDGEHRSVARTVTGHCSDCSDFSQRVA